MRSSSLLRLTVLLFLSALYLVLTQHYRAYDIDNPWFLSFSYNASHLGLQTDTFEQVRFPGGMDGVHLFGKIAAALQSAAMNQFGWSPVTVTCLNTAAGFVALWFLWSAFLAFGYSQRWVAAYIVMLGTTEPIVSMMEKARFEYFVFLLLCLALWSAAKRYEFLASLLAFASVETEPAAIILPLVIVPLLAFRTGNRTRLFLKVLAAGLLSIALYLWLHPGAVQQMIPASKNAPPGPLGGAFRAYFIDRRRHLLDAAFLLGGVLLALRHRYQLKSQISLLLALLCLIALLLLHTTPAYVALAMPLLLWPSLEGYFMRRSWQCIPAAFLFISLAGYCYLFFVNRKEGFGPHEFQAVSREIDSIAASEHRDPHHLPVAGDYSLWFAHPDNYRAIYEPGSLSGAALYLCFDSPLQANGLSASTSMWCGQARQLAPMHLVSTLVLKGHLLNVYLPGN